MITLQDNYLILESYNILAQSYTSLAA